MQNFNYHQHTYRCKHADFNMTDEEYVQEYIKLGLKEIAFTDHCPQKNQVDTRPKMRMDYDKRGEYLESIERLKKKYEDKIKIKSGYEFEYLPDQEDNIKQLKSESDILIQGQHFVYDKNNNLKIFRKDPISDNEILTYAEYIEKAIELGFTDIVAHPDIYMLGREGFGEVEEKVANRICAVAEKYNIPLEINLNQIFAQTYFDYPNKVVKPYKPVEEYMSQLSEVAYPCEDFWKVASKYNVKVLYGIDSHFRGQVPLFKELIILSNEIIGRDVIEKLNFVENVKKEKDDFER